MSDFVLSTPDQDTFYAVLQTLGYWDPVEDVPVNQGFLADGSGQYFLNEVGTVYAPTGNTIKDAFGDDVPEMVAEPGYWARLRLNGTSPYETGERAWPVEVTVYPPVQYLEDGVTPDPDYTQPAIGMIA